MTTEQAVWMIIDVCLLIALVTAIMGAFDD